MKSEEFSRGSGTAKQAEAAQQSDRSWPDVVFDVLSDRTAMHPGLYVSSPLRVGPGPDLASIPRFSTAAKESSEDRVRTSHALVLGYRRLQNES